MSGASAAGRALIALVGIGCGAEAPSPAVVDVGAHPSPSLVAVVPSSTEARGVRGPIAFDVDPDRAESRAAREDRALLVFATAEWSVASAEMARALEQPALASAARAAVALRLDLTDADATAEIADRYRITAVPTVVVRAPGGAERFRADGLPLDRAALIRALAGD